MVHSCSCWDATEVLLNKWRLNSLSRHRTDGSIPPIHKLMKLSKYEKGGGHLGRQSPQLCLQLLLSCLKPISVLCYFNVSWHLCKVRMDFDSATTSVKTYSSLVCTIWLLLLSILSPITHQLWILLVFLNACLNQQISNWNGSELL